MSGGRTCHLSQASNHFCQKKSVDISFQPAPDSVPEVIPFSSCDAETGHAVIRALCRVSRGPTIEASEHVVWTASGDPSDTDTSSYLFIFEVNPPKLFAFPVDGEVLSCISDYHRGRGILCFIFKAPGGSVALYRYAHSDRWLESDSFTGFVSDRALLSSPSFVLEHCSSGTPFVIVGTTRGVKSVELSHDNRNVYPLSDLQAVKLLRHNQCGAVLYVLTLDGLQVYNVRKLRAEPLQPLKWSVAELSLDGRRIALAGTYPDQSCWIQVWNTANQEVVLNVTMDECDIASIAVTEKYVCYHLNNITGKEWKLACLELESNSEELVLWEDNRRGLKNSSLTLDGNILVERVWCASPYAMNLYRVPQRTSLHTYKSKYPTLAYLPGTSGAQDNRCRVNSPILPSTVQGLSTSQMTMSGSVSSTVQPTSTTGSTPGESAVPHVQFPWIIGFSCGSVMAFLIICAVPLVGVILICCGKAAQSKKYPTNEEHPETLNAFLKYLRNWKARDEQI